MSDEQTTQLLQEIKDIKEILQKILDLNYSASLLLENDKEESRTLLTEQKFEVF